MALKAAGWNGRAPLHDSERLEARNTYRMPLFELVVNQLHSIPFDSKCIKCHGIHFTQREVVGVVGSGCMTWEKPLSVITAN